MLQIREDDTGDVLKRGTRVTLHLKEDAYELASEKKLGDLIKQYSELIQFPIRCVLIEPMPSVSCCNQALQSSVTALQSCMLDSVHPDNYIAQI